MPTALASKDIIRARRLRKSMTDGEKKLWTELKQSRRWYGIHVRRQIPLGPYVADLAIHEHCLIIEVDGEHHFMPEWLTADRRRDEWFDREGYEVLRFTTGELSGSFDGCVEEVMDRLGLMTDAGRSHARDWQQKMAPAT